jgi:hypothetical protein
MNETIEKFLGEVRGSLFSDTFIKLTLGNYKGNEPHLQKLFVRPITTKKGSRLYFQMKYLQRDIAKNHDSDEGIALLREYLTQGFRSGHLFTTDADLQIEIGKRNARISRSKPTFEARAEHTHDRSKNHAVNPNAFYLKALGITNDAGKIRSDQRDKWKQINKFVEILAGLFANSALAKRKSISIVDMGSGKGYLTFAVFDHFANMLDLDVQMTGIELRNDMVDKCNAIAEAGGYTGLRFLTGSIDDADVGSADIVIALHACDTATDDALFKGITANASIITAAPCCHREVRRQMHAPEALSGILKHAVLFERTAESVTDGLRSMLLELAGYSTKMFEFVATEHTPKNNLLVAVRRRGHSTGDIASRITDLARLFGIRNQRLADSLAPDLLD